MHLRADHALAYRRISRPTSSHASSVAIPTVHAAVASPRWVWPPSDTTNYSAPSPQAISIWASAKVGHKVRRIEDKLVQAIQRHRQRTHRVRRKRLHKTSNPELKNKTHQRPAQRGAPRRRSRTLATAHRPAAPLCCNSSSMSDYPQTIPQDPSHAPVRRIAPRPSAHHRVLIAINVSSSSRWSQPCGISARFHHRASHRMGRGLGTSHTRRTALALAHFELCPRRNFFTSPLNMWCLWNLGLLAEPIFGRLAYLPALHRSADSPAAFSASRGIHGSPQSARRARYSALPARSSRPFISASCRSIVTFSGRH